MRIVTCLSQFHPTIGGAERQLLGLARSWVERGHAVQVVTRAVPGLPPRESYAGIEIHRAIRTLDWGPLFGLSFIHSLGAQLRTLRHTYDVVLAGQLPWEAVATGRVCSGLGKPAVARVALLGPRGDAAQIARARGSFLLRRWLRGNSRFVVPDDLGRTELTALGCASERISHMTNGVDLERFRPSGMKPDAPSVLWVGRLVASKRPQLALRLWARVAPRFSGSRLIVAGSGPLRPALEALCREQAIPRIDFRGQVGEMPELYAQAHVLLVTSEAEGCSNALLEAMASGLCPVVSDVPGNRAVIRSGENGLLVSGDDEPAWAEALARVLDESQQRQAWADAAREHVAAYHALPLVAERYLQMFSELLEQPGLCAESAES